MSDARPAPPCPLCGLPLDGPRGANGYRMHKCAALQDVQHEALAKFRYLRATDHPHHPDDKEPPP